MKRLFPLLLAIILFASACQAAAPAAPTADPFAIAAAMLTLEGQAALTNVPPTLTPTNTQAAMPTFTPVPTATLLPMTPQAGYQLTTGNVCIALGGNEHIVGNMEIIWVESVAAFQAGNHYQHSWKSVSDITKVGNVTLNGSDEDLNDTLQAKSCWDETSQSWKGWVIDRDAASKFPFWVGISFSQWLSSSTMAINEDDVNGLGSGKYAELGTTYTFAEMRLLPGASEISAHINAAEALATRISAGQVYIPVDYATWSGQWVMEVFQK